MQLVDLRNDLRGRLNEASAGFWTDPELNRYINEGFRDLAIRTRCLPAIYSFQTATGTQSYPTPANAIQVHRVEYVVSATFVITLVQKTFQDLYSQWGTYRFQGTWPRFWTDWGYTNQKVTGKQLYLWPIPSQANTVNVFYYRLPQEMTVDTDFPEVPLGMEQCAVVYAEYIAKRKDGDPTWKDSLEDYEKKLKIVLEVTRKFTDQQVNMFTEPDMGYPYALLEG